MSATRSELLLGRYFCDLLFVSFLLFELLSKLAKQGSLHSLLRRTLLVFVALAGRYGLIQYEFDLPQSKYVFL